jgi:hypothetical protein
MSELVLHCASGRHVLGVVSPATHSSRIYLFCRKCKAFAPTEPPRDDADLDTIRCCRRDPRDTAGWAGPADALAGTFLITVGSAVQLLRCGELLARVRLAPGTQLVIHCQKHRTVVNRVVGLPPDAPWHYRQTFTRTDGRPLANPAAGMRE